MARERPLGTRDLDITPECRRDFIHLVVAPVGAPQVPVACVPEVDWVSLQGRNAEGCHHLSGVGGWRGRGTLLR
jgi:hypothetical protein